MNTNQNCRNGQQSSLVINTEVHTEYEENILIHHVFLFQDLVHFSCSGWTLKLLAIQKLILQLLNGLNRETFSVI